MEAVVLRALSCALPIGDFEVSAGLIIWYTYSKKKKKCSKINVRVIAVDVKSTVVIVN